MKKIIFVLLITLGLGLLQSVTISPTAFADTAEEKKAAEQRIETTTFSVGKYLKLDKGEQRGTYFEGDDTDGIEGSPIVKLIVGVIDFAIIIIGTIAVILIIITGFRFMLAQGNEQDITNAKDMFKYAIIGLIIALLSYTITTFVQSLFIQ